MSVLNIGCGAGVDLCVASILVGKKGTVTGVDVTPAMVDKARLHATLATRSNVTASVGTFESLPSENKSIESWTAFRKEHQHWRFSLKIAFRKSGLIYLHC